jgi:hypothetical protein
MSKRLPEISLNVEAMVLRGKERFSTHLDIPFPLVRNETLQKCPQKLVKAAKADGLENNNKKIPFFEHYYEVSALPALSAFYWGF